jgi:hypothetical protein
MLYCQKCQHEYEETGQRFCINDNSRLVPVGSSQKSINQAGGVFSTILSDVLSFERTERISAPTREFVRPEIKKQELPQTVKRDLYKTGIEDASETDFTNNQSERDSFGASRTRRPRDASGGQSRALLGKSAGFNRTNR